MMMLEPERVSPFNKTEDRMGVHIIGKWQTVLEKHRLKSQDMSPRVFLLDEFSVKNKAAMIIYRGDQMPALVGRWSPEVVGRIMLYEFSSIAG
jgi:hypothetical protein